MSEPLWSDERIKEKLEVIEMLGTPSPGHTVFAVLMIMRDDYERVYRSGGAMREMPNGLKALLEKYERLLEVERAAHKDALDLCAFYEARIAELQKRLAAAGSWEAVEMGEIAMQEKDPEEEFDEAVQNMRYGGIEIDRPSGTLLRISGTFHIDTLETLLEAWREYLKETSEQN